MVIPETPAEGQNVTFSVQNVTGTIRQIDWYRGQATNGGSRIFTYFPGNDRPQRNGVQHTQREFGFPNGSLFISDVQLSDAQIYSVLILLRSGKNFKGTTDLHLAGEFCPCFEHHLLILLSWFSAPSLHVGCVPLSICRVPSSS